MAYFDTNALIAVLLTRLLSLPIDQENPGGEKLFQRVDAFGANRLMEAMQSVFASEQRVCFVVPGGDKYSGARDRSLLTSRRRTSLALLIADRSLDTKAAPLVGGPHNLGILAMKDRVIADLVANAFTGPDLAFEPGDGEPLLIQPAEKSAGNLGRECWMQWLGAYAGEVTIAIP